MRKRPNFDEKLDLKEEKSDDIIPEEIVEDNKDGAEHFAEKIVSDHEKARAYYLDLMSKRKEIIDLLLDEFRRDPTTKIAYALRDLVALAEIPANQLLKNTQELVKIFKEIKKARNPDTKDKKDQTIINVENAIFSGNINDILKMKSEELKSLEPKDK